MRSDLARFPRGKLVCHAEENIKNTEQGASAHSQQYFLFAQIASSNPLPVPVAAPASSVLVESGPVVYDDAAAEEEDEEEEETCVSAMDLMGSNGQFKHTQCFCLSCSIRMALSGYSHFTCCHTLKLTQSVNVYT